MSSRKQNARPWTRADEARLRKLYPATHTADLPSMFGRSKSAIRVRAAALHLKKDPAFSMRRPWQVNDDTALREIYSHLPTAAVARRLHRSICSVNGRANKLGLRKSDAYLASPAAHRIQRDVARTNPRMIAHRFPRGHVPANKGVRRPGWHAGRMGETQFKKGHVGHNWKPVGSTRLVDGYVYRKVADTRLVPWTRNWKPEHILVWERSHGRLPRHHCLAFKNGDRLDIRLDNLELISRRENMARNTVHNLPRPLRETVQLLGTLKRSINRRSRREEQDRRSA